MDAFGIEYYLQTPQQFWLEISDILNVPKDATLRELDASLRIFISFCATYHERYLSTLAQLDHSCQLLLESDFFTFHSGRSCGLLLEEARNSTNPHQLFILYNVFLCWGSRHPSFFRTHKRWRPLLGHLMDHLTIDIGEASADFIEGKLALLACEMLYEICRVQKMSLAELKVFKDSFIEHLFEVIESTRSSEILNYSLIKLIVALNEQFMVASVGKGARTPCGENNENRVILILVKRLNESKTFGENLIFMLNRIDETEEDRCLQLLILKMLYLLFTTPGTQEYFYMNDLRVLVEVFVRELNDLSDEEESLKHTYLRVLHPLLNNTQLRNNPHKALLIRHTLQNSISHAHIRDIDTTTRRLVDRCLSGEWIKSVAPPLPAISIVDNVQAESLTETVPPSGPDQGNAAGGSVYLHPNPTPTQDPKNALHRGLTRSASVDHLSTAGVEDVGGQLSDLPMPGHVQRRVSIKRTPSKAKFALKARANSKMAPTLDVERSNDSNASLASVAAAHHDRENQQPKTLIAEPRSPSSISDSGVSGPKSFPAIRIRPSSNRTQSLDPSSPSLSASSSAPSTPLPDVIEGCPIVQITSPEPMVSVVTAPVPAPLPLPKKKKPPPPPPPKQRRKPPPPPTRLNERGDTIQTIASSLLSPLNPGRNQKSSSI